MALIARAKLALGLAGVVCALAGCDTHQAKLSAPAVTQPVGQEIRVDQIDKAGFDSLITTIPGRIVLVDSWATWCPVCRENFPHTVELSRKYGPEGLVVITLACDDIQESDQVLTFLKENNAVFQNLRADHGSDEKTFEDFAITGGALPHFKLYDRKGKLRKTFASDPETYNQFTLDDVEAAVVEVLNEEPDTPTTDPKGKGPAQQVEKQDN